MDKKLSLQEIASIIGAEIDGDKDHQVIGFSNAKLAQEYNICFLDKIKFLSELNESSAGAVIVRPNDANKVNSRINKLIHPNPHVAFALVSQLFDNAPSIKPGIHKTAQIGENVILGKNIHLGAFVVIDDNVVIGDDSIIESHTVVGANSNIGIKVRLHPHVVVYHNSIIEDYSVIHSGSVIGSDGFGYANDKGNWIKVQQIGRAVVGKGSEIGALTTIDRGSIEDTVVESNVIIDNHIHLGHNAKVEFGTAMAAGTIVAGSSVIGKYCLVGGASVINGHIRIPDQTTITGMAMVVKPPKESGKYISSGIPTTENLEWKRQVSLLSYKNQINLKNKIFELEKRLQDLENK